MRRIAGSLMVLALTLGTASLATPPPAAAALPACTLVYVTEHATPEQAADAANHGASSVDYNAQTGTLTETYTRSSGPCSGTRTFVRDGTPGWTEVTHHSTSGTSHSTSGTSHSTTGSGTTGTSHPATSSSGCGSTAHGGPKPTKATTQTAQGCSSTVK